MTLKGRKVALRREKSATYSDVKTSARAAARSGSKLVPASQARLVCDLVVSMATSARTPALECGSTGRTRALVLAQDPDQPDPEICFLEQIRGHEDLGPGPL